MRVLSLFVVGLLATSCVPPSCFPSTYGFSLPKNEHFVGVTVFAEPLAAPQRRYAAGVGFWELFDHGSSITIDVNGGMVVSTLSSWPQRCPRVEQEDVVAVSRTWRPIVERMATRHMGFQVMAHPYTGEDDWRPDGPVVQVSLGSSSGKSLGLLWDGRSSLPDELDTAVMATLELMCSNSRLGRKHLLRDLPRQVASRLDCRPHQDDD